jgi:hypothetical protein
MSRSASVTAENQPTTIGVISASAIVPDDQSTMGPTNDQNPKATSTLSIAPTGLKADSLSLIHHQSQLM